MVSCTSSLQGFGGLLALFHPDVRAKPRRVGCLVSPTPGTLHSVESRTAFELTLPAHADAITCVRHLLEGLEGRWDVTREQLDDIQIATIEACTNVVIHAYRDREPGLLEVHGGVDDGHPTIAVRDHGTGIVPRTDSPGLGVGLPLMGALTDDLHIGVAPDGAHEVRMRFPRRPA
ncbi:hypothetical protein C7Y72_10215 [Paraconexibacter algicola]|uniref:Histidine kinase/HSP90-like ATPase domain-containing protein n=1 Tax=Paraconexibacter algicola TaxID=2133960 RepID=A0A2T4UL67_9ACTN|nr:hypothetical protein C7Y72_10215 [Paraconexibacter algicola]